MRDKVAVTVTIEREQKEWLDEKPEINLSGLTREAIEREIEMGEKWRKDRGKVTTDDLRDVIDTLEKTIEQVENRE